MDRLTIRLALGTPLLLSIFGDSQRLLTVGEEVEGVGLLPWVKKPLAVTKGKWKEGSWRSQTKHRFIDDELVSL